MIKGKNNNTGLFFFRWKFWMGVFPGLTCLPRDQAEKICLWHWHNLPILAQFAPWKDILKSSDVSQSYHCGAAGVQCMKFCHYRPQPKTVNILDFFKNAVQSFFWIGRYTSHLILHKTCVLMSKIYQSSSLPSDFLKWEKGQWMAAFWNRKSAFTWPMYFKV